MNNQICFFKINIVLKTIGNIKILLDIIKYRLIYRSI